MPILIGASSAGQVAGWRVLAMMAGLIISSICLVVLVTVVLLLAQKFGIVTLTAKATKFFSLQIRLENLELHRQSRKVPQRKPSQAKSRKSIPPGV